MVFQKKVIKIKYEITFKETIVKKLLVVGLSF